MGLQQLGWTDGRNVQIDTRWAGGNANDIRRHAVELAGLSPEVILANGSAAVAPLLQATRAVPIVFVVVPDPVWRWLRRKLGAARWQRHGLYAVRIRHWGEMAGTAQADRTPCDASGSPSGRQPNLWDRPVRRNSSRGAVARHRSETHRRERRWRDRASRHSHAPMAA